MAQIIEGLHRVYVKTDAFFSKELNQLRITSSALMTGHIKRHYSLLSETLQSLVNRCGFLFLKVHSFLSFLQKYIVF